MVLHSKAHTNAGPIQGGVMIDSPHLTKYVSGGRSLLQRHSEVASGEKNHFGFCSEISVVGKTNKKSPAWIQ